MLIVLFFCSIVSFCLSSFAGGGASIVLIPLLGLSLPPVQVPAALVIGTFSSSLSRVLAFQSRIHWKLVSRFLPMAIPGTFAGAFLLRYVDVIVVNWITGFYLLWNVILLIQNKNFSLSSRRQNSFRLPIPLVGFFAGMLSAMVGAIGLALNSFYFSQEMEKEEIVATRAANEITLHLLKLVLYFFLGLFSWKAFQIGLLVAAGAVVASIVLKRWLSTIGDLFFYRLSTFAMAFASIFMFVHSTREVIRERQPRISFAASEHEMMLGVGWANTNMIFELEKTRGFVFEREISFEQLPESLRNSLRPLIQRAQSYKIEAVTRPNGFSYEVHYQDESGKFEIEFPVKCEAV